MLDVSQAETRNKINIFFSCCIILINAFGFYDFKTNGKGGSLSDVLKEQLNRDAVVALLDKIGPAVLFTHSQSGSFAWAIADIRPGEQTPAAYAAIGQGDEARRRTETAKTRRTVSTAFHRTVDVARSVERCDDAGGEEDDHAAHGGSVHDT